MSDRKTRLEFNAGRRHGLVITDNMGCNVSGATQQKKRFYFCDLILVFIKRVLFDKLNLKKKPVKIEQCARGQRGGVHNFPDISGTPVLKISPCGAFQQSWQNLQRWEALEGNPGSTGCLSRAHRGTRLRAPSAATRAQRSLQNLQESLWNCGLADKSPGLRGRAFLQTAKVTFPPGYGCFPQPLQGLCSEVIGLQLGAVSWQKYVNIPYTAVMKGVL